MSDTPYELPRLSAEDALAQATSGTLALLDLRKTWAAEASGSTIKGAAWQDPYAFSHEQCAALPTGAIAVFCVHGHEVSQFGCALMLLHGIDAKFVVGGFEALVQAGAPLEMLS